MFLDVLELDIKWEFKMGNSKVSKFSFEKTTRKFIIAQLYSRIFNYKHLCSFTNNSRVFGLPYQGYKMFMDTQPLKELGQIVPIALV